MLAIIAACSFGWALAVTCAGLWLTRRLSQSVRRAEAVWVQALIELETSFEHKSGKAMADVDNIGLLIAAERKWAARHRKARLDGDLEARHIAGIIQCAIIARRCEQE